MSSFSLILSFSIIDSSFLVMRGDFLLLLASNYLFTYFYYYFFKWLFHIDMGFILFFIISSYCGILFVRE